MRLARGLETYVELPVSGVGARHRCQNQAVEVKQPVSYSFMPTRWMSKNTKPRTALLDRLLERIGSHNKGRGFSRLWFQDSFEEFWVGIDAVLSPVCPPKRNQMKCKQVEKSSQLHKRRFCEQGGGVFHLINIDLTIARELAREFRNLSNKCMQFPQCKDEQGQAGAQWLSRRRPCQDPDRRVSSQVSCIFRV
jgi:hypothetical protein